MVMHLPTRSSSAGLRSIHREFQRRRSKPLAPARSVGKKPSMSPPPPPPRHGSTNSVRDPRRRPPHHEAPSSSPPISETPALLQVRPRASSRCVAAFPPPPPPRSFSVPSSAGPSPLRPGTVVGVRTRTTTLKTGQVLVLWLRATVVSSTSHGDYEVVYDSYGDLKGTVRVARPHVRVIKTSPSAMTPPPSPPPPTATVGAAAAAQKKERVPAARPTTAGKSVRVIRRIILEKERQACAALSGVGH